MDMRVSDAITAFVEFALPRSSPEERMLHIPVDASLSLYTDEEDFDVRRDVHFLFQRPHNYTKVFLAIEGMHQERDERKRRVWVPDAEPERVHGVLGLNQLAWFMTSDHDSCWRSDGVDSQMFAIRNDMMDEMERISGLDPKTVHQKAHWHVWLSPIGHRMQYVNADIAVDEVMSKERNDTYFKLPVNIREA